MAQLGNFLHIFISIFCVATVNYESITVNEAAKLKLWSGAGRNANELCCGGVKNVEGALSVTQTILKDCKKQWGRVQKPENIIFKKHPMVSKRNLDFTIKCDKLGPPLLPHRKHWSNISGVHFAESKNYTNNNREENGKPRQRPSSLSSKQLLRQRMLRF